MKLEKSKIIFFVGIIGILILITTFFLIIKHKNVFGETSRELKYIGEMKHPRFLHNAISIGNNKILITGGSNFTEPDISRTAEVFDLKRKRSIKQLKMKSKHFNHSSVMLPDGNVFITGEYFEIFNPKKNSFQVLSQPCNAPSSSNAVLLNNKKVLISGCSSAAQEGNKFRASDVAFLYNVDTKKFKEIKLHTPRDVNTQQVHSLTAFKNGDAIIIGGCNNYPKREGNCNSEIIDSEGNISIVSKPNISRFGHQAILLDSGNILIIGGYDSKVEEFSPYAKTFTTIMKNIDGRTKFNSFLTPQNKILIIGGTFVKPENCFKLLNLKTKKIQSVLLNEKNLIGSVEDAAFTRINNKNLLLIGGRDHTKVSKKVYLLNLNKIQGEN